MPQRRTELLDPVSAAEDLVQSEPKIMRCLAFPVSAIAFNRVASAPTAELASGSERTIRQDVRGTRR